MSAAEILALLHASPRLAVEVADALQVARPWEPSRHYLGEQHGQPTGKAWHRRSAMDPERYVARAERRADGRWDWWHIGKVERWRQREDDSVTTPEEACKRADLGLAGLGWGLA